MKTPAAPTATRRRGAELDRALLSAAWSELRSGGYQAFTIDAVARAAGTSRAVLYRRWPNRAALVHAAVRMHTGTIEGHLPDTGSLAGDALAVLTIFAGRIDQIGVDVTVGLLGELEEIPEDVATIAPRSFAQLIDRARERGELGPAPVPESVLTMPTTLVRYAMITERTAPAPEALVHIVDELFLPLARHQAGQGHSSDFPEGFTIPALPPAVDEWFGLVAGLHDAELIYDGAILDGLCVVDADSARAALEGYRFVNEGDGWIDAAPHGGWDANWIVIEAIGADPLIADVSTPEVQVFEARHGQGSWEPRLVAESLHEFIAEITVNENVPSPPGDDLTFDWSIWLVGLGPEPRRTLVGLMKWPMFPRMSRAELLRLDERLPMLIVDDLTETVARNAAGWATSQGFLVEVRRPGGRRAGGVTGGLSSQSRAPRR